MPGIQLVSKPGSRATGIGRYADEILHGLRRADVAVREAEIGPRLPRVVSGLGRRLGYDADAFLRSYPPRAETHPGYLTHLTTQSLATLLFTQRLPRPVVVTVHDILPFLLRDDRRLSPYRHRFERAIDGLAMRGLRRADRLIAVSHYTKQTIVETFGISPQRIDVVHNGVDLERFRPRSVPQEFRDRYRLLPDRRYVVYVGSENPRKDLPTLLEAIALLRRGSNDKVELLKVGSAAFAEQRAYHLRLCERLQIGDVVRWFDEVGEEDLPLFYAVADVFAFPSLSEGFGFPVLEALACGTPVVARRTSSLPELADGVATLLTQATPAAFAEAIQDILAGTRPDPAGLVQHAREFTWPRTIEGVLRTYRSALGWNPS